MDQPTPTAAGDRRPPTAAEARALGHPLRLKILFACRERARSNKELAAALSTTPGTIHYHLKQLVEQGFLRAEPPRPGPRGSTEQPYLSTGKSWQLSGRDSGFQALRDAAADELRDASDADAWNMTRLGLSLPADDLVELSSRIDALVDEFAARSRTRPGDVAEPAPGEVEEATLIVALQRAPWPRRGSRA